MVTIEPGGVFGPVHDHVGRPGTVYILQGTITDHRDGVATDYGPGVGWPEDRNTNHWLENRGTTRRSRSQSTSSGGRDVRPVAVSVRIGLQNGVDHVVSGLRMADAATLLDPVGTGSVEDVVRRLGAVQAQLDRRQNSP